MVRYTVSNGESRMWGQRGALRRGLPHLWELLAHLSLQAGGRRSPERDTPVFSPKAVVGSVLLGTPRLCCRHLHLLARGPPRLRRATC